MGTLNFDFKIFALDGVTELAHAGKLIADMLMKNTSADNIFKYYDWATSLYHGKEITLDDHDRRLLMDMIKNDPHLYIISKAPMLRAFDVVVTKTKK